MGIFDDIRESATRVTSRAAEGFKQAGALTAPSDFAPQADPQQVTAKGPPSLGTSTVFDAEKARQARNREITEGISLAPQGPDPEFQGADLSGRSPLEDVSRRTITSLADLTSPFNQEQRNRLAGDLGAASESQRRLLASQTAQGAFGGVSSTVAQAGARELESGLLAQRGRALNTQEINQRRQAQKAAEVGLETVQRDKENLLDQAAQAEDARQFDVAEDLNERIALADSQIALANAVNDQDKVDLAFRQEGRADLADAYSFALSELQRMNADGNIEGALQARDDINVLREEQGLDPVSTEVKSEIEKYGDLLADMDQFLAQIPDDDPRRNELEGFRDAARGLTADEGNFDITDLGDGREIVFDLSSGNIDFTLPDGTEINLNILDENLAEPLRLADPKKIKAAILALDPQIEQTMTGGQISEMVINLQRAHNEAQQVFLAGGFDPEAEQLEIDAAAKLANEAGAKSVSFPEGQTLIQLTTDRSGRPEGTTTTVIARGFELRNLVEGDKVKDVSNDNKIATVVSVERVTLGTEPFGRQESRVAGRGILVTFRSEDGTEFQRLEKL